ncbi:dentin sialophosphoprotein-like isoform X2 [Mya arenaria]|uniref:dentin sialophosphoprotein-like isoform X2 n=1 Tax=Mya arenaria TaxID=6604 RepID=UPI0022E21F28|nr:dentin sialophosphoprotein-like isoform X2 [Mya arenaria]
MSSGIFRPRYSKREVTKRPFKLELPHGLAKAAVDERQTPKKTFRQVPTATPTPGDVSVSFLASTPKPGRPQLSRRRPRSSEVVEDRLLITAEIDSQLDQHVATHAGEADTSKNVVEEAEQSPLTRSKTLANRSQNHKQSRKSDNLTVENKNESVKEGRSRKRRKNDSNDEPNTALSKKSLTEENESSADESSDTSKSAGRKMRNEGGSDISDATAGQSNASISHGNLSVMFKTRSSLRKSPNSSLDQSNDSPPVKVVQNISQNARSRSANKGNLSNSQKQKSVVVKSGNNGVVTVVDKSVALKRRSIKSSNIKTKKARMEEDKAHKIGTQKDPGNEAKKNEGNNPKTFVNNNVSTKLVSKVNNDKPDSQETTDSPSDHDSLSDEYIPDNSVLTNSIAKNRKIISRKTASSKEKVDANSVISKQTQDDQESNKKDNNQRAISKNKSHIDVVPEMESVTKKMAEKENMSKKQTTSNHIRKIVRQKNRVEPDSDVDEQIDGDNGEGRSSPTVSPGTSLRAGKSVVDMDVALSLVTQIMDAVVVDTEEEEERLACCLLRKYLKQDITQLVTDIHQVVTLQKQVKMSGQHIKQLQKKLMHTQNERMELEAAAEPNKACHRKNKKIAEINDFLAGLKTLLHGEPRD